MEGREKRRRHERFRDAGLMSRERLVYDADCGVCEALARWVAARTSLAITGARGLAAVRFIDGEAHAYEGAAAINRLALRVARPAGVALALIERIPPLFALERLGYALVARHRARLSRLFGLRACGISADD